MENKGREELDEERDDRTEEVGSVSKVDQRLAHNSNPRNYVFTNVILVTHLIRYTYNQTLHLLL